MTGLDRTEETLVYDADWLSSLSLTIGMVVCCCGARST